MTTSCESQVLVLFLLPLLLPLCLLLLCYFLLPPLHRSLLPLLLPLMLFVILLLDFLFPLLRLFLLFLLPTPLQLLSLLLLLFLLLLPSLLLPCPWLRFLLPLLLCLLFLLPFRLFSLPLLLPSFPLPLLLALIPSILLPLLRLPLLFLRLCLLLLAFLLPLSLFRCPLLLFLLPLFRVPFLPPSAPPPPPVPSSSSSSSSSAAFVSLPSLALADHQARLLGLSSDYQSLARWFLTSGGSDFVGLVRFSFPHLLPDLARDFSSGSSLFLTALRSVSPPPFLPPSSSGSSAASHPPLSAHLSSTPMAGGLPPAASSSQSLPFLPPAASSSLPPPPGFSYSPSSASFPIQGSSMVHGLGVGVPPSSGVPPSPLYSSAATAYAVAAPAPAWPPSYPYDPYAPSAPLASTDPFSDDDEHFPDDIPNPLDPSAPPLSLDSARSEYCRMIDYVCGLFPQAAGVPPPRALFESFFAPATPSINFNWFDRVCTSLVDADSRVAALLASGRPERLILPQRLGSYAVRGECSLGRAVSVNESLLSHFERPLRPTLQMGITVRDAMALEASCRVHSEALSYSMWVLLRLLGFVRLQDFNPTDPALFNQLVTALSKSLAHQAQVTDSYTVFLCHHRRGFYLSHLPAYFSDVTKRSMLSSTAVYADSLFREEDVSRLLEATRSSSSLKSQQAMVDVASRRPSSSSVRQRRGSPSRSPRRSPAQRRRQSSASPSRASKRVRFDSPAPSSALKSPRKSHFRD